MSQQDDRIEHEGPPARFATHFRVGHNAFQFLLDFGLDESESGSAAYHTRIITSPDRFDEFMRLARRALAEHTPGGALSQRSALNGSRSALVLENLDHLDALLQRAYDRAQELFEREAGGERRPWEYRGLHVSRAEAERLMSQRPGTPLLSGTQDDPNSLDVFDRAPVWAEFGQRMGFTSFDQAITMLALAPELDLRYERLYSYLQDDVTRRWPTVSLALDVLAPSAETKLEWRSRFAEGAQLIHHGLLKLLPDTTRAGAALLDRALKLDDQAVAFLLGDPGIEGGLEAFSEVVEPVAGGRMERPDLEGLASLITKAHRDGTPMTINFQGPRGNGQREAAASVSGAAGARLMVVDTAAAIAASEHPQDAVAATFRSAWLHDAVLLLDGVDALMADGQSGRFSAFNRALANHRGIVIVNSTRPWPGAGLGIPFDFPEFSARREEWFTQLRSADIPENQETLDALAGRFLMGRDQIAEAVSEASLRLRLLAAVRPDRPLPEDAYRRELLAASRVRTRQEMAENARRVEPGYRWTDLVMPPEVEQQLREIAARASLRYRVLDEWGFGKKIAQGKGISVLFSGPSGAGKTMAAEVIASELGLDLYKIDLSGVISKYIGETEKNLEKIFTAAERSNAILFFDEADALFGKRSEAQDALGRYANIEVSYLLQRMEQFDGLAILATNLRGNLDEAFMRRLACSVRFQLPGEAERLRIWNGIWPSHDLLAADVNLAELARKFKLTGGNIRNIALAASYFAAERNGKVTRDDLLRAIQREYEKVGRAMSMAELVETMSPGAAA